jgi:acyl-CoA thioesterase-2
MRDGNRFAMRNVVGVQRDEVTFHLVASFHQPERGAEEFQQPMPEVPAPDTFPSEEERTAQLLAEAPPAMAEQIKKKRPIEFIRLPGNDEGTLVRRWMRVRQELVEDPNLHRCALAYASDMGAIEPCIRALGVQFGDDTMQIASLDHALWFHRPFRADEWLLMSFEAISVAEGRGLARGSVHDQQGRLVASIAQEGVMRSRS